MSVRRRYATLLLAICQLTCWPVARYIHSASCPDRACCIVACADSGCQASSVASCTCEGHSKVAARFRVGPGHGVARSMVPPELAISGAREEGIPHSRTSCALCTELAKSSCLPPVFTAAVVVLPDAIVSQVIFRIPELAARMRFPARGPPV